jgi:hypothetical protein
MDISYSYFTRHWCEVEDCGERHSIELIELHLEHQFHVWNTFLNESWQVLVVNVTKSYVKNRYLGIYSKTVRDIELRQTPFYRAR